MNKYKQLALNTMIFTVGSFGSKIISVLMNNLYTKHISPEDLYTKSLLENTALFLIPVFIFSMTANIFILPTGPLILMVKHPDRLRTTVISARIAEINLRVLFIVVFPFQKVIS